MKKKFVVSALSVMLALAVTACGSSSSNSSNSSTEATTEAATTAEEKVYGEYKWPKSEIASLIPQAKSTIGEVYWENSNGFVIYVAETTQEDYDDYVDACMDAGFTEDYHRGDTYFWADNEDGYSVDVRLEDDDVMFIRMDAPKEVETTEAETEEVIEEAEEDQEEETAEVSEEVTEEIVAQETSEENSVDFKEVMDGYLEFMDEYVAFMTKYQESDDTLAMLADYTKFMSQYAEMMDDLASVDTSSLSSDDLAYFLNVQKQITEKLLEVAGGQ